jgi:hypothetical protein
VWERLQAAFTVINDPTFTTIDNDIPLIAINIQGEPLGENLVGSNGPQKFFSIHDCAILKATALRV